jgi:phage terminase large subunit GpA-like protein
MSDSTSKGSPNSQSNSSEVFDGELDIRRAWSRGLSPEPTLTVSEWADKHRFLSSRASSEPGKYRTSRTPYMFGIQDALSPSHPARTVVFIKGAQIGGTEAGNNWIGYCIDQVPGPFLAVQPTTALAKRFSEQRITPLIEETPRLKAHIMPSRSRDSGNTIWSKRFTGGQLVITGGNSAVGLRSMPARYVFCDEVDAYPGDIEGEGDPVALATARTRTFGHRAKVFLVSTPTIKGFSRIEREFERTDQRRYFVPCPFCGHMQWLQWPRLRWEDDDPESARYYCEGCEEPIAEHHKTQMLERGEWRPTVEKPADANAVGYHVSALYSPIGWRRWADMANDWINAKGDDAKRKTFINTDLGETYQERGEAPDWQRLYDRREDWLIGKVPMDGLVLTAGADVQRDRIEVDIWAWGQRLRSWLVDHIVLEGDPSQAAVWKGLDELLGKTWLHESGARMVCSRLAVDSGDGMHTSSVYAWVRKAGASAMAVKGDDGFDRSTPVQGPTYVDVNEHGKTIRRGVRLYMVSGAVFKSETYRFLRQERPTEEDLKEGTPWPDGYIHLPKGISSEWVKQLTSEQLKAVKNKKGFTKLEWHKMRERNEALDCRVYARAAAWLMGIDRWSADRWEARSVQIDAQSRQETGLPILEKPEKRSGGYMGGRKKSIWP